MFDFLNGAAAQAAVPAGHHAIQFIRQWAASAVRANRSASLDGLPPEQLDLAKRIVGEIEAREGRPAAEISEAKIGYYINSISDRLQELSRRELRPDLAKGKKLLAELRSIR